MRRERCARWQGSLTREMESEGWMYHGEMNEGSKENNGSDRAGD